VNWDSCLLLCYTWIVSVYVDNAFMHSFFVVRFSCNIPQSAPLPP
jgi:hypothetical protein